MDTASFARAIRLRALELCYSKRTSHIGGAFSAADILGVLYNEVLDVDPARPQWPSRDRLFYSKGHACTALYAALELRGFFEPHELSDGFTADGSYFTSHINHRVPGVELSTGSLGHALGVACGAALAGLRKPLAYTVFTILSDGELDEGSNWEAILFAAHHKLANLIAVVDYNKIQSFGSVEQVMTLEPLADKFRAFNWTVEEVDGHDLNALSATLGAAKASRSGAPRCIIAHTVKGKGVSFMEQQLVWHYRSPAREDYDMARIELGAL